MKLWLESLLHLVLPNSCVICKKPISSSEPDICIFCTYELTRYEGLTSSNNAVEKTFWGRVQVENAFAYLLLKQGNSVQKLIHQLKYKNKKRLGIHLGETMAEKLIKEKKALNLDLILPMPLHPKKFRLRGYNQSSCIANGLSKVFKVDINEDVLIRKDYQNSQTNKGRIERWENVKGSFCCVNETLLEGKHVLIVDDVLTTGATMESCINCIKTINKIKISVACLAYAP